MAELTWHYTQQTKRQHFIIDNKMYETFDGGQNIKKYVDGVIDYDYKNKRLIQSLNDIFKKSK